MYSQDSVELGSYVSWLSLFDESCLEPRWQEVGNLVGKPLVASRLDHFRRGVRLLNVSMCLSGRALWASQNLVARWRTSIAITSELTSFGSSV